MRANETFNQTLEVVLESVTPDFAQTTSDCNPQEKEFDRKSRVKGQSSTKREESEKSGRK